MIGSFKKLAICFGLVCSATASQAGSSDGLSIAVVVGKTGLPYVRLMSQFLADPETQAPACGGYALNLKSAYTSGLPRQLTSELALASVNDKVRYRELRKIMTSFRDETVDHGFDAVLAYEVKEDQLQFYGISGARNGGVLVSKLSTREASDQKKFVLATCQALAKLPVLVEP